MAEIAVSSALKQLISLLRDLQCVHKEFADIKDELESIRAFLKDADRRATVEEITSDGVQIWVKQLTKAAFRIEDVLDKYMIYMPEQPHHLGFIATSLHKIVRKIKTLKPRWEMAFEIKDIKSDIRGIKDRRERYAFDTSFDHQASSSNSFRTCNIKWHDPRIASFFIEEDEVVGFEAPRDELIRLLVRGAIERTIISVVGMGGAGKTTLAKKVFDNKEVIGHFDCRACISVSQSYTIEELLKEMMKQFCEMMRKPLPQDFDKMNKMSLITQLRNYIQQKRYVVLLDDIWQVEFWDEIEFALPKNHKGSRIIITTRNSGVAEFCKKYSRVLIHNLQPLHPDKAWELFCKKAFRFDFNSHCPIDLKDLSVNIVEKCRGLPLAIVAIGGLLSTKEKTIFEWDQLRQNIFSELESNSHLVSLERILALSYEDLPFNLKPCFLHFGIYPEDYSISCNRLMMQWIAEGFIQYEKGKTIEEVAEQYLSEFFKRSLIQVSRPHLMSGNAMYCQIHDLLREMIIKKMEELNFCHLYEDNDVPSSDEIIRRVSVSTNSNDFLWRIEKSFTRSMYIFKAGELPESRWSELFGRFKLLRVLEFEHAPLTHVTNNVGNLLHLRYLCLRGAKVRSLPRTIGKLQNLETLDLRQTLVREMPREINKLRKLRHLMILHRNYNNFSMSWNWETGVKMKDKNIGGLTSLQTLFNVEVDRGGVDLIEELKKLRQLRDLRLLNVRREYGKAVCVLINEMKHLQRLSLSGIIEDELMDLHLVSSPPPQLKQLFLRGRLEMLPDWIPRLEYLVDLLVVYSKLTDDPLKLLKGLPNLSFLAIEDDGYEGEILHFEECGFQKLKRLKLRRFHGLKSILIDKGALPLLQEFEFGGIPQLKEVPFGIRHLQHLQVLHIHEMQPEFNQSIDPNLGHWVIQHVPIIHIHQKTGRGYHDYETRTIRRAGFAEKIDGEASVAN